MVTLAVVGAAIAGAGCHSNGRHFTVNSTADSGDAGINGTCATSAGTCTLRAALQEANAGGGHDIVGFAIPGSGVHRISPTTALPTLTDRAGTTIDGYTESGSAVNTSASVSNAVLRIEVRGPGLSSTVDGFRITSPGNVLRGMSIYNFRRAVQIDGVDAAGNEVIGNWIGTDALGTARAATEVLGAHGVNIKSGADDNQIGKSGNANRNVLSGNGQFGVAMYDGGTARNRVQNNIIGLRPDGSNELPNRSHGIDLNNGVTDTLLGGSGAGQGNVVSGNGSSGIEISHDASTLGNDVIGNRIGTNAAGTAAPAYAGNDDWGVNLEGEDDCRSLEPPDCPTDAGESTVSGNVIVNNGGGVLVHKGRHDDVITNNFIGVLANGTTAAGNRQFGVRVEKGSFRTTVGPGNVIARNGGPGVAIVSTGINPNDPAPERTPDNRVTRNRIFLNAGLGIDLAPLGSVTPNPSSQVNDSIDIPVLAVRSSTRVDAQTCAGCTIELFVADTTSTSVNGEGQQFLTSAVANSSGTAQLNLSESDRSRVVSATATSPSGDTSEFSRNVSVPAAK